MTRVDRNIDIAAMVIVAAALFFGLFVAISAHLA
jgi:hypothetical protein